MEPQVRVTLKTLCGCERILPHFEKYPPQPVYRVPICPPIEIKAFDPDKIDYITIHTREFELERCKPSETELERLEKYPYSRFDVPIRKWEAVYKEKWREPK